jgi:hypothetical protein
MNALQLDEPVLSKSRAELSDDRTRGDGVRILAVLSGVRLFRDSRDLSNCSTKDGHSGTVTLSCTLNRESQAVLPRQLTGLRLGDFLCGRLLGDRLRATRTDTRADLRN